MDKHSKLQSNKLDHSLSIPNVGRAIRNTKKGKADVISIYKQLTNHMQKRNATTGLASMAVMDALVFSEMKAFLECVELSRVCVREQYTFVHLVQE